MKVVVGVDAGGTKAAVRVETLDGVPRADVEYPADGWEASPVDTAAAWLMERVHRTVPAGDSVVALGVGAQGCDTAAHCAALAAALDVPAVVVNDAALLVPAAGLRAGIGLIAGTGSIAVARMDGRLVTAGGWGWVLGDEGGAAGLVREAARAVLGQLDSGEPADPLARRLLTAFEATDGAQLAMAVTASTSPAWLGEWAIEIFDAADEGSALAVEVIREAGRQLAALVDRLLHRGVAADQVVAGGSVLLGQRRLHDAFVAALRGRHPDVTVHLLDRAPVLGALALGDSLTALKGS